MPLIQFKTTILRPDARTRVEIRSLDPERFEFADSPINPPPIHLRAFVDNRLVTEFDVKGDPKWRPWGLSRTVVKDIDGDGRRDVLLLSFCHYGGSGSATYLTVLRRTPANGFEVIDAPRTASENIHTGEFYLARAGKKIGIVVTRPLMDNATRPEPTHWNIATYGLEKGRAVRVAVARTARRHSELVPGDVVRKSLPRGWSLVSSAL